MSFFGLTKDGKVAGATVGRREFQVAVHDGDSARMIDCENSWREAVQERQGTLTMSTITPAQPVEPPNLSEWIPSPLYRMTLEQYERVDSGVFTERDRFHLINGFLVVKMTQGDPHCTADDLCGAARGPPGRVVCASCQADPSSSGWQARARPVCRAGSDPRLQRSVARPKGRRPDRRSGIDQPRLTIACRRLPMAGAASRSTGSSTWSTARSKFIRIQARPVTLARRFLFGKLFRSENLRMFKSARSLLTNMLP